LRLSSRGDCWAVSASVVWFAVAVEATIYATNMSLLFLLICGDYYGF
jgi:hypothetical protein